MKIKQGHRCAFVCGGSETKQRVTSVRPPQSAIVSAWDLMWFMVQETGEERERVSRGGGVLDRRPV